MNLIRTVDADSESISIDDVKAHLRVSGILDDDAFRLFIAAIRHKTETFLGKTLITSTWEYKLDGFTSEITLPMTPVQSIESISYIDTSGIEQAFTDFQFDKKGRLKPSYGNSWPVAREQYDSVTITYVSGESDVQEDIRLAMLLWIGSCDIAREGIVIGTITSSIPDSSASILAPYRNIKL